MNSFSASYLEIESRELVRHLLRTTGQCDRDSINTSDLLDYLKLDFISFDFARELPDEAKQNLMGATPRALLSFADRLVATDESLDHNRTRFSVLHEIGHFVLPHHEHALYVCDDVGMSFGTRLVMEKEANEFAAELLFLGDRFCVEANSRQISALTVKELANSYHASFESTARRLVEKSFRPCMLIVFKEEKGRGTLDASLVANWVVRYCIASPAFKTEFFEKLTGNVPTDVVNAVTQQGRDIANSEIVELQIDHTSQKASLFRAEFYSNSYNIFCLLTPIMRQRSK